jgi:hypothetical protein
MTEDRIKKLREDPDFRELVKLLKDHEQDRLDAFSEHYECNDDNEASADSDCNEEASRSESSEQNED